MPAILYAEERKRLLDLHKQADELAREEEKALEPLEAEARKHREALHREFPGEGSMHWSDIQGSMRLSEIVREKLAPFEDAVHAAREPFKAREAELHKEIDAIEKIIGSLRSDNEGRWLTCAITGLPLLESDGGVRRPRVSSAKGVPMTDSKIITISLFLAGVIPFTLLGGWGDAGDHSILLWSVGFLTQAGFMLGFIGQRRKWWG